VSSLKLSRAPGTFEKAMKLKTSWTLSDDEALRDYAAKGWSPTKIALRLRRTVVGVKRRAWLLEIQLKEQSRLPRQERLGPLLR
jgi:hypothetical protein